MNEFAYQYGKAAECWEYAGKHFEAQRCWFWIGEHIKASKCEIIAMEQEVEALKKQGRIK